jgi:catechol 2,3-dioxygenase
MLGWPEESPMLPPTNFQPPFNITRASHLTLTSRDLAKARDFYTEVVGLKVSDESATTIYFRGVEERAHHSLTLRRTKDAPECERVGFRVSGEEELEKAKAWFDANGRPAKFVNLPFQGRTLHAADANRTPLEFCARMKTLDRAHTRVHEHKGAAALRMDHVQMLVPDVREASTMYLTLGFRVSDYSCAGVRIVGMLLHRKDNPHDLVLQEGAGPRLHHFGLVVQEMQDIMRAMDVAGHLGFGKAVEFGPGRHGHSRRLYVRDPDAHRIALLLPPIQVIDRDDEPVRHEVLRGEACLSGSPPRRTWFEEATLFAGVLVPRGYGGVAQHSFGEGLGFREHEAAYLA